MAVALDVPAWTRGPGTSRGGSRPPAPPAPPPAERRLADLERLARGGAGPQDSVPSVWQELGAAGRAGAGRPRTFSDGTPGRAPENIS